MKRKTIAVFAGYALPHLGGIERFVDKLSIEMTKLNYKVIVVTFEDRISPNIEYKDNITIYRLPSHNMFHNRYPIPKKNNQYNTMMNKIKNEGIDIVVLNTKYFLTSVIGARLGYKLNVPVIEIEHNSGHFTVNNRILDFFGHYYEHIISSYVKRYINYFYGSSKDCNRWLKHFKIESNGLLYNGVNPLDYEVYKDTVYNKKLKNKRIITFAGRLLKEKGITILINAFNTVNKDIKDIVLVIAGIGPMYEEVKQLAKDNPNIIIAGKLDFKDLMPLYNQTDVFALPTIYPEGLPTSVMEAGLMKCVVIATDKGGTDEILMRDEYGYIINPDERELVDKLVYVLNKDHTHMKEKIHKHIKKNFSITTTAINIDKLYNQTNNN